MYFGRNSVWFITDNSGYNVVVEGVSAAADSGGGQGCVDLGL